jgi:hypothetical protein
VSEVEVEVEARSQGDHAEGRGLAAVGGEESADRIMKERLKRMMASEPARRGISSIQPIERYGLAI